MYDSNYEVDILVSRVQTRLEQDEQYTRESRQGSVERQQRRLIELIIEAVREYMGRVIPELVTTIRSIFGV